MLLHPNKVYSNYMIEEWHELKREQIFSKYSCKIEKVDYKLPNGTVSDFYIKGEGVVVSSLALTPDNQVVLVKQFRPGPQKVLLEIPGGGIEPGEDHLTAAKRELLEESGYQGEFEFIGTCLDDAYSTMIRCCYVATNCKKVAEPIETPTEKTEPVLLNLQEFRKLLRSGEMTDVEVGYLGLDYLGLL